MVRINEDKKEADAVTSKYFMSSVKSWHNEKGIKLGVERVSDLYANKNDKKTRGIAVTYSILDDMPKCRARAIDEKGNVIKEEDEVEVRDDGILTAVAQGGYTLSGAIKVIKSLFADGKLKFDSTNKLLPYCFYNLKVRADANNNLTPHKAKSSGHIDGAVALFNAFVAYDRAKQIYAEQIPDYFKI